MQRERLTPDRIRRFTCATDAKQSFLWDTEAPRLAVRATAGAKSFIFEAKLNRQTVRATIGDVRAWSLDDARAEARRLQTLIDQGIDPRQEKADKLAAIEAKKAALEAEQKEEQRQALTVGEAWASYLEERQPHWGERNYTDHLKLAQEGGEARQRRPGVKTKPGPLAELMPLRLADLTTERVEQWAAKEALERPARVRLALRLLKAFLRWAATDATLKDLSDPTAASSKKVRETAGKAKPKNDYLQREQLPAWFSHVRQIQNPVISAYLQCLLLTGARREEMAELKWEDVNFQWKGMSLKDKIEDRRQVPLTPYVQHLIGALPRRNEYVFSSPTSDSGHIEEPSIAHRDACAAAGLELTLHGLRRSFASLCEWLDIPGGISAQIQGHAPQGVREQNYIRRPLDLLRVHHNKIEAWILEQAGIEQPGEGQAAGLRVVEA
ncbi:integrase arm-type DNA-binding domain-containing protein [Zoogloea sp. LCSB751]|uniref:tyrosine-type recombinase/integrase n=1 Tax=Zoogloea sp. LCSB751 TaxID=1965277 RepID=UPI0009A48E19|nr:integrase arm-type DNA-binding domain-containing protein [Zoogloea sp. LCSB751]